MKSKIILLFLMSALTLFAQNNKTKVIISSNLPACYIFIDGKFVGNGKVELNLTKGKYNICLKESLLKWTGNDITDLLLIDSSSDKIEKYYKFENKVLVNSIPQNARVIVRDSIWGYTPLFINAEIKNLTLEKDNFRPLDISLNGVQEYNLGTPVNAGSSTFARSPWFKVLLGTAAVIGTVAAYYKIQADKSYDNYLNNRNSSVMDEVNRYDTISGIAMGALQINFGILLYLLLTE